MRPLIVFILVIALLSCSDEKVLEKLSIDNIYYDRAYKFLSEGATDSAFLNFSKAKDLFMEVRDSLNTANCLVVMAVLQKDVGDYFGAQETALEALDYLNTDNPDHFAYLSSNYNNLGVSTYQLKDYNKAKEFYSLALKYSTDSTNNNVYLNNLAKVYHDCRDYESAIAIYAKILNGEFSNKSEYARFLTNAALSRWNLNPSYHAIDDFLIGLEIRKREGDLRGLNSSYTHLTDYYTDSDADSALFYAKKLYSVSKQLGNIEDEMKAVGKLAYLSSSDSALYYFKTYQLLADSIQQARAVAKNQFALIRYEVEKNKADNLRLQKDNAEKSSRLTRQRTMTGGVAILFILAVSGGIFYYKKRKQRLELEAQNRIKASKLETSKKVHDVVANGLYRVMKEIEYKQIIDREYTLDKLEEMYNKSRDISYETEEPLEWDLPYHKRLTGLIKSFANDFREVFIVGNGSELWDIMNDEGREHIRQVLQELMVNMDKHSQAANVVVRFENRSDALIIYYSDDGIGLAKGISYGNGLKNTVSRIESLGGKITFDGEMAKGLKIEITIPFL